MYVDHVSNAGVNTHSYTEAAKDRENVFMFMTFSEFHRMLQWLQTIYQGNTNSNKFEEIVTIPYCNHDKYACSPHGLPSPLNIQWLAPDVTGKLFQVTGICSVSAFPAKKCVGPTGFCILQHIIERKGLRKTKL